MISVSVVRVPLSRAHPRIIIVSPESSEFMIMIYFHDNDNDIIMLIMLHPRIIIVYPESSELMIMI